MSSLNNHTSLPQLGFGLGLRMPHISHILEHKPRVDWFEIISENYMENEGKTKRMLARVAEYYPIVMHGVSLSIGSSDPLNSDYLKKLKMLMKWVKPAWVSDHLCWTGVEHKNTHDLLPVPYTEEALLHIVSRIKQVQDILECKIALENPSTYLEFASSSMPEPEFIARMVEAADCHLLLDVNNVYVSCYNHSMNTKTYFDALPLDRVIQIHLSGHSNHDTHIIDTHDNHVIDDVWALYRYVISKTGRIPNTMIEWDAQIPEFSIVFAELEKARNVAHNQETMPMPATFENNKDNFYPKEGKHDALRFEQSRLQEAILSRLDNDKNKEKKVTSWIREKFRFSAQDQLEIYAMGYRLRLYDAVYEDYPALRHYLGEKPMDMLIKAFVSQVESHHFNLTAYSSHLPDFIKDYTSFDNVTLDLARLERALVQVNFAPETDALKPEHLLHLDPEIFMQLRIALREALVLLEFCCDINTLYRAIKAQESLVPSAMQPHFLAVFRHEEEVWRLTLEEKEYRVLQKVSSGLCLLEAIEATYYENDFCDDYTIELWNSDVMRWFARWLDNGLLVNLLPLNLMSKENAI